MTTLRELAGMAPDHSVRDFVEGRAEPPVDTNTEADLKTVSSMPGDDVSEHPFIKAAEANPYWGKNPQAVFRAVKEGTIPDQEGRKHAMAWLKACEACGEHLFERRG